MLRIYQFKNHCKGDSHSSRTALFYHESLQNDICSFRAMTVALTVSFKLVKLLMFISFMLINCSAHKPI